MQTDATGTYRFDTLPVARCRVGASLDGFATAERAVDLATLVEPIVFRLGVQAFAQQIVVTPTRGEAQDVTRVAQAASVVDQRALETRPFAIVTQVLKEEVGVMAQQTTSSKGRRYCEALLVSATCI